MIRPRLVIVKTGRSTDEIVRAHGDFEGWFSDALGERARFTVVVAEEEQPDLRAFDGVIVTGSPSSVTEERPWMLELASRLAEHAEAGGALLGVCFGHQLLGHAFGAKVERNPRGREIGTALVELTPEGRADPLFEGLPPTLVVNETHVDHVRETPAGTTLLATNGTTPVQALRLGARARSVQFHPEITASAMRALIASRADAMRSEGLDPDAKRRAVEGSPHGLTVLRHFEERLCGRV